MYAFRRILAPTDFSRHADAALAHAVFLGEQYNADITLLHVDEFSVSPLGAQEGQPEFVREFLKRKREFFDAQFVRMRAAVAGRAVSVTTEIREGSPYKVIVESSERGNYDLIVIATRGHSHLASYLIGSTAERVVRLSRQPVLSIMEAPKHGDRVRSVLCPTDLSPAGNVALSYAISIARQSKAMLYIQYISELDRPEREDEIRKRLPDLKEHHPLADQVKVTYVFDRDLEPSNSIIRFADDRDIDLIVMSTHGRKGLRRVYIGNNTAEVVRTSVCPVLTVTHPLHKQAFASPVTEKRPLPFSVPETP